MKILLAYSSKTKNTKKVAEAIYDEIKNWTVSEFREWLLDLKTTGDKI